MKFLRYLILLLVVLLQGCFGPVKNKPMSTYMLNTVPCKVPHKASRNMTLMVTPPDTRPIYNTTRMAYTARPFEVAYFGQNQWAETPSQMLMPLMVQSLQKTQYFHAIVTPPFVGRYNYILTTQLLELQQNFIRNPNRVELIVRAQLTQVATNRIVATKQFCVTVPIRPHTPYGGVIASNYATERFLTQLNAFVLRNAR